MYTCSINEMNNMIKRAQSSNCTHHTAWLQLTLDLVNCAINFGLHVWSEDILFRGGTGHALNAQPFVIRKHDAVLTVKPSIKHWVGQNWRPYTTAIGLVMTFLMIILSSDHTSLASITPDLGCFQRRQSEGQQQLELRLFICLHCLTHMFACLLC